MFQECGLFDINVIEIILSPLLKGKDIDPNITLKDFYEITKIDIHFFTTNLNEFEKVDVNHISHPEWTVLEAVYASSCAPLLCKPLIKDGITYIDGAFFVKNPLNECILNENVNPDEILCVHKKNTNKCYQDIIETNSDIPPLFNYIHKLISAISYKLILHTPKILYNIQINKTSIDEHDVYSVINNINSRKLLIEHGIETSKQFLESLSV
jgi:predicted patatin/cPLA2 family phospholipase